MSRGRAVWLRAPREAELRDEVVPSPGEGEVRVRALASAISHGTEMLVYRGQVSQDLSLDLPTLQGSFGFPIKYGYASVGRVEAVGPGVSHPAPGDQVFVHHPHQDSYVVAAERAIPLPAGLVPEIGCFLANVETALNVLLDTPMRLGEVVLILGQGVIGLLLLQLAQRAGAGRVIAVDPLPRRRALARELGAWAATEPGERVREAVMQASADRGADVVLEASGNPQAVGLALACAAFQASVVVCSWYGSKRVELDLGAEFHRRRLRLVSSQVSNLDPALTPRWNRARRTAVATDLLSQLRLQELITHRFPFAEAPAAYELIDQRPEEIVQVVLTY